MKYAASILLIIGVVLPLTLYSQEKEVVPVKDTSRVHQKPSDTTNVRFGSGNVVSVIEDQSGTEVVVGRNGGVIVQDKKDTIRIKVGKKGIKIVETGSGTTVEIMDVEDIAREFKFRSKRRFKGHWSGFELGMNNYLTPGFNLPNDFMSLSSNNSWNVNFNILQYSLNIAHQSIGLVTGMGFQLNDYKFRGTSTIARDATGNIVEVPLPGSVSMSKFHVDYFTIPLIMEFHLSPGRYGRRLYIAGGVIGSLKLRAYTRVRYTDQNINYDIRNFDDYSVTPIQAQVTFRAGFKFLRLFANYNITPLFQNSPELYPYSIGLVLLGF